MGEIIEFKKPSKSLDQDPVISFWQKYKDILRKYHDKDLVERIVAAILDKEVYETTDEHIRYAADLYFKHAPERNI
jgi:hypothetical protein